MPTNNPQSSLLLHRLNPATTNTCPKLCQQQPQPRRSPVTCATTAVPDTVARYHAHAVGPDQCCSAVTQQIAAPISAVWPVVRRFDNPQAYKHFVKSCHVVNGDGNVGTVREIRVISGLPAANSTERLEILDDERHVISFSMVGGDHRLANYKSVTTLHPSPDGKGTVVVESFVVDTPRVTLRRRRACLLTPSFVATSNHSLRSPRIPSEETEFVSTKTTVYHIAC